MSATYFDEQNLTIEIVDGENRYQLDLEQCVDSASLLDWILQLHGKDWSAQALHDFLECLNEACKRVFGNTTQGVFCPFGQDRSVDWLDAKTAPMD